MSDSAFGRARKSFHAALFVRTLTTDSQGTVSNADKGNATSRAISKEIASLLKTELICDRIAGQTSGRDFESACSVFLKETFPTLGHLRPGQWEIRQVSARNRLEIANYDQYSHLVDLDEAAKTNPKLAAILGNDYTITPDVVIFRETEDDDMINSRAPLIDETVSFHASLRRKVNPRPILHASISCKWTIRSDRAQNARPEALNLIRNRKGRLPHIVVVTAEPLPSRLASLALGTGDIDCVYHFALNELQQAVETITNEEASELLSIMVQGKRLKDISDLPLDLAV